LGFADDDDDGDDGDGATTNAEAKQLLVTDSL
jgi:hypothetical protein